MEAIKTESPGTRTLSSQKNGHKTANSKIEDADGRVNSAGKRSTESDSFFDNIPGDLKQRRQWVVFKFGPRKANGKLDKIPFNPRTMTMAKVNDSATWDMFDEAVRASLVRGGFDGIGYVFSEEDPYTGIDLDSCRDPQMGQLEPWALDIVQRLDSYTEASPSGKGIHIITKAQLPGGGGKREQLEMYDRGRFFTFTGEHIGGTPPAIEDRQPAIETLYNEHFQRDEHRQGHKQSTLPEAEIARIQSALDCIAAVDYEVWLRTGMALHSADSSDCGFTLWRDWSATCPEKFNEEDCKKKWRSFKREGVTLGTLFEYAFQGGWSGNGASSFAAEAREHAEKSAVSEPPWPVLAEEALHGLAGDIVRTIDPYTEADKVAVLLNVLTAFGNCINSAPYARVQHDNHPVRLFVVQVGDTSKGRKGTGWSTPRYLFSLCDPDWSKTRVKSGLSSGEGLIYNVRDSRYAKVPRKEKGKFTGDYDEVCVDEGEQDKRLLIVEPEFASVLTVANREGNTLSEIVRQAWDHGNLSPLTKNNPMCATDAHVSLIAHITKHELLARLDDTSKANGFANRFLWCLVKRSKELPEGGAVPDALLLPLAERLSEVITFARTVSEVKRDDEAKALWADVYHDLSEGKPGLLGAVLSRAEAQVLRLSVIYALLDKSGVVRVEHLRAALAVWEYCERSAVLIFGKRLGDPTADRIVEAIHNAGEAGMSDNDIYEMFGRNKSANERARAVNLLLSLGLIRPEKQETGGRPRTIYRAT